MMTAELQKKTAEAVMIPGGPLAPSSRWTKVAKATTPRRAAAKRIALQFMRLCV